MASPRSPVPASSDPASVLLELHLSSARLSTYIAHCAGDLDAAIKLYEWNTAVTGAFWEQLGYLEIMLRNTLDRRLHRRHQRLGRQGTWLDDPARELRARARDDIATARERVRRKGKPVTHDQVLSELSFGFWRFLLSSTYSGSLWPDLAGGFPHASSRNRVLVEGPVVALHDFRNRLGHHQRIWSEPLADRARDLDALARLIDPDVAAWVKQRSRVAALLANRP